MAEKNVTVRVILHPPGSNPAFHFESDDLPIGPGNNIFFSNCGKSKGFIIRYTVDDSQNQGFRFPTSGNNYLNQALWVTSSGACPLTESHLDTVFKARSVENVGQTLVVWNKNAVAQNFFYTLRLFNGTDWLPLDPGGTNQNGGLPLWKSLAGSIVTGAIVAIGTIATVAGAIDPPSALLYGIGGAVVGLVVGYLFDR